MWPESLESGRLIRELGNLEFRLKIRAFAAHDYFGNGSLELRNTPGVSSPPIAFFIALKAEAETSAYSWHMLHRVALEYSN